LHGENAMHGVNHIERVLPPLTLPVLAEGRGVQ
jgi:hypothetical protein